MWHAVTYWMHEKGWMHVFQKKTKKSSHSAVNLSCMYEWEAWKQEWKKNAGNIENRIIRYGHHGTHTALIRFQKKKKPGLLTHKFNSTWAAKKMRHEWCCNSEMNAKVNLHAHMVEFDHRFGHRSHGHKVNPHLESISCREPTGDCIFLLWRANKACNRLFFFLGRRGAPRSRSSVLVGHLCFVLTWWLWGRSCLCFETSGVACLDSRFFLACAAANALRSLAWALRISVSGDVVGFDKHALVRAHDDISVRTQIIIMFPKNLLDGIASFFCRRPTDVEKHTNKCNEPILLILRFRPMHLGHEMHSLVERPLCHGIPSLFCSPMHTARSLQLKNAEARRRIFFLPERDWGDYASMILKMILPLSSFFVRMSNWELQSLYCSCYC